MRGETEKDPSTFHIVGTSINGHLKVTERENDITFNVDGNVTYLDDMSKVATMRNLLTRWMNAKRVRDSRALQKNSV